ncbi:hypothetical protein B0J12DRAFT_711160 [Macrophomina phaseolina]|uniref:AB hydrolase-1 domain-containing protein n=1 Tax=Macrophomina phaseolina TaxID=35725 RepID=A0ABQ8GA60_9PEZI|nr:hypothetical protein B0J12DRAFT_711160 [Macrophomina phaseolina]
MTPHILIVPGSFMPAEFYIPLRNALLALGNAASIAPLLSAGRRARRPATKEEDATHIREEIRTLVERGEEVAVAMHSYGAIPGTESVRGLLRAERRRKGKSGGVVRLVYMAGVVPGVGASLNEVMAPWIERYKEMSYVRVEGDYLTHELELSARITFSDLPFEEGMHWARRMVAQSGVSFDGKLVYPGYRDVAVSYVVCTQDMCVPLELQRAMIRRMEMESGRKVHVMELNSGHSLMVSRLEEAAKFIDTAIEKGYLFSRL